MLLKNFFSSFFEFIISFSSFDILNASLVRFRSDIESKDLMYCFCFSFNFDIVFIVF